MDKVNKGWGSLQLLDQFHLTTDCITEYIGRILHITRDYIYPKIQFCEGTYICFAPSKPPGHLSHLLE